MMEEFNVALKNHTLSLVPPSSSQNIVECKWVFWIKHKPDGSIEHYKARLVAKSFHQQSGIDYDETFSPIVKPATIWIVLSVVVSNGWSIRQLRVKNALLHDFLHEEVYMSQPLGFVEPLHFYHVCKLHKALYGLKQAPHAWFHHFSSFLLHFVFTKNNADSSLFIFRCPTHTIILLLYVDDIVVTGNSSSHLDSFIQALGGEFDIKDLGLEEQP